MAALKKQSAEPIAALGFEAKLGEMADKQRAQKMDAAEYKHDVLGRFYDPACGSGGMFVQSEKNALALGGRIGNIGVWGRGPVASLHGARTQGLKVEFAIPLGQADFDNWCGPPHKNGARQSELMDCHGRL